MSHSSTVAQEQLDYRFLLLTHIVCADQQIHSEKLKYLKQLGDHTNISQHTKDEMEKILAQDNHHLTVDYITKQISLGEQSEVMRQILAMANLDGDFSSLERELINKIGKIWNWSEAEINWYIKYAEKFASSRKERIKQEMLLAGEEYSQAVENCSKIAQEDYQYAELAFNKTEATLNTLIISLEEVISQIENKNSKATTAKEVAKQLEDSKQSLDAEIIKRLAKVRESHLAKQRALNQFSIAFMGRTKAGKSTLHSIITQDGWESIGVGKQRTTRFNRVYQWKNIRIIDTPGIGAADAGGKNDEEIAKSIIDEADVICYVVTNDSIQETEFQFLKLLKERAKLLIILLNIKYNLRDSRRLQHFLKNPDKLFALEGKSGIGGHIDRIRRYANQYYANDYFPIVPVMLLAAQLSSELEHQENKDKLFKASRIQDFLDSICKSLIKHGTIRRSQTFLGSTVGSIEHPNNWVRKQKQNYQQLIYTLKNKRQTIHRDIHKAETDALEFQQQQIESVFRDAFNAIQGFAEDHWNEKDENRLNRGWKQKLNGIKFEQRIKNSCEEAADRFNEQVKESLEEIGKELQLISQLNSSNFSLKSQDSFDTQKLLTIGGSVLGVAGGFLTFVVPPVGIAVMIVGGLINFIGSFWKSRKQKRLEAITNISSSLESQMKEQKQSILKQTQSNLSKYCFNVFDNVNQYFDDLIQGLEAISSKLEQAQRSLDATVNYLNYGYAKRIVDWATEQNDTLTIKNAKTTIAKVKRNFGRSIDIKTQTNIELKKSCDEMKQILQEDISITS
ncbi:MAG: 50S ribosome-binding GTPase [Xenococcaceae cyanobacterium MO_207.B15]|nr:50S ribosome-binding GTPase [Xenococcaceae cyanobacterium MO_207.B15]